MKTPVILIFRYSALSFLAAIILLTSAFFLISNSGNVLADDSQHAARKLRTSGQILSLEKIHEKANLIKPGKILETELENKKGLFIYEIELLDNMGVVWELKLDAKTGKLIKLEED